MKQNLEAQSLAVKRAQVEFHNFASLGDPDRAVAAYRRENRRRAALIRKHLPLIGGMSPFLEIGANAGHSSYMLANEFGASGFALDISADALRHGVALRDIWGLERAPVRVAGDALRLPFAGGSLGLVCAFQMLSQFMDAEKVFLEVKRVLAPGGVFLFAEEPLKRLLTLRLYRCPYYDTMKPWERKLYDWGLLGYLVRDVIGAYQEESFGIRQNHSMGLKDWCGLIDRHFASRDIEVFVPQRGWGERVVKSLAVRMDPAGSEWRAARLLGGTLAAVCRKAGSAPARLFEVDRFERCLCCPDCGGPFRRDPQETLRCERCSYSAPNEGAVYNLLPSKDRAELYPGDRDDIADFSQSGHEKRLSGGWYGLEGVFGNKYRWIGESARVELRPVHPGPQRLRIRGHSHAHWFRQQHPPEMRVVANGVEVGCWRPDRTGLFVFEADLPDAGSYAIELRASPAWRVPADDRTLTVSISMVRLTPRE